MKMSVTTTSTDSSSRHRTTLSTDGQGQRRGECCSSPWRITSLVKQGRGFGLVTTRHMRQGETILTEQPMLKVECLEFGLGAVVLRRRSILKLVEETAAVNQGNTNVREVLELNRILCFLRKLEPLRHRDINAEAMELSSELESDDTNGTSSQQATDASLRQVWERNSLTYFSEEDHKRNFILHALVIPFILVIATWFFLTRANSWLAEYSMSCFAGAFCLWFFCLTLKTEMFICFKSEVLFERSSRLNHCCTEGGSTAVANLDPKTGQLQLLTTKAVGKGTEITIDYLAGGRYAHLQPAERKLILQEDYGFLCTCKVCNKVTTSAVVPMEAGPGGDLARHMNEQQEGMSVENIRIRNQNHNQMTSSRDHEIDTEDED